MLQQPPACIWLPNPISSSVLAVSPQAPPQSCLDPHGHCSYRWWGDLWREVSSQGCVGDFRHYRETLSSVVSASDEVPGSSLPARGSPCLPSAWAAFLFSERLCQTLGYHVDAAFSSRTPRPFHARCFPTLPSCVSSLLAQRHDLCLSTSPQWPCPHAC